MNKTNDGSRKKNDDLPSEDRNDNNKSKEVNVTKKKDNTEHINQFGRE